MRPANVIFECRDRLWLPRRLWQLLIRLRKCLVQFGASVMAPLLWVTAARATMAMAIICPGICAVQLKQKLRIGLPVLHGHDGLMGGCGRTF